MTLDLDMSPYAAFVWPAWIISVAFLGALAVRGVVLARRWKRALIQAEAAVAAHDAEPDQ